MSRITNNKVAYGKSQALIDIFNQPVIALRSPTLNDKGSIGQQWVNKTNNTVWVLTSYLNGGAVWTETDNSVAATGITWTTDAGGAINLANNHGYYLTNVGAITCTLPLVSAVGTEIWLITQDSSAGGAGIIIAQNAAQFIRIDADTTTPGIGGSMSWLGQAASQIPLHLICTIANTEWSVVGYTRLYSAIV